MFELQRVISREGRTIGKSELAHDYPKESFLLGDPDNSPIESILYYSSCLISETKSYSFCIVLEEFRVSLPIKPELSILLGQIGLIATFLRTSAPEPIIVDFFNKAMRYRFAYRSSEVI